MRISCLQGVIQQGNMAVPVECAAQGARLSVVVVKP